MARIRMVRRKIAVSIDQELVKWIDMQVESKRFRNRSHAVEWALAKLREEEKKKRAEGVS